jgi:radical SAM-linked protein
MGALRYIGHLDLQTLWERAARRAGLPLAYSHGFHPQAKIHFASALPLGFSSRAEVMDMRLQSDLDLGDLPRRLKGALPAGIEIVGAEAVDEAEPALQTRVSAAEYEVTLIEMADAAALQERIDLLLRTETLPRERRGKAYDLRPLLEGLGMLPDATGIGACTLFIKLSAREGATGRPEEVLAELGISARNARIERTRLIFQP